MLDFGQSRRRDVWKEMSLLTDSILDFQLLPHYNDHLWQGRAGTAYCFCKTRLRIYIFLILNLICPPSFCSVFLSCYDLHYLLRFLHFYSTVGKLKPQLSKLARSSVFCYYTHIIQDSILLLYPYYPGPNFIICEKSHVLQSSSFSIYWHKKASQRQIPEQNKCLSLYLGKIYYCISIETVVVFSVGKINHFIHSIWKDTVIFCRTF